MSTRRTCSTNSPGTRTTRSISSLARIPFARVHDANYCFAYGAPHIVDVSAVFPDFDADADDPASYDFIRTDAYLQTIADAWHTYTEVPAEIGADGSILLSMEPCSFVLLEW